MNKINSYIYILIGIFLLNNLILIIYDDDLLGDLYKIIDDNIELIDDIHINKVFSNSFFFTAKPNLQLTKEKQIYMIKKHDIGDVIFFRVNTIKNNDSLYFFQHIDWITKRARKIEEGNYSLNKINHD